MDSRARLSPHKHLGCRPQASFPDPIQIIVMKICNTIEAMRAACREAKRGGKRLGFVPTMGALHAGHVSLVRAAKGSCDAVAASIFVNPLQFGPTEDLGKYPRSFDHDCALLQKEGVDLLFAP